MYTTTTIKEVKVKKFRYAGHLKIKFAFSNKAFSEEKTVRFKIPCFLLEKFENELLTDVEFLKRFLQTCHKFGNITVLTKFVCNQHKRYINNFIFNL